MKTRKPKPFIHHLPLNPGGGRALCDKRANAPRLNYRHGR